MKKYVIAAVCGAGLLAGCAGRPSLVPNSDPNLRRTSAQFAADAAKRHPYKSDAPRGGEALGRAEYDLVFGTLQVLNYSDEDWDDVEIWVNRKYVCWLPKVEKGKQRVKTINFQMLYDEAGNYFWTNGGKTPIQEVELYRNGKIYTVPTFLQD
jgi:hypothetical protein